MNYLAHIGYNQDGIIWSVLIVLIVVFLRRRKVRPQFVLPQKLIHTGQRRLLMGQKLLIVACLVLLPLQVQLPTSWQARRDMLTVQVVLDVSLSMSAADLNPNRFAVAKQIIEELVVQISPVRIGLLVFSGVPVEVISFSQDISAVLERLTTMSVADFPLNSEFLGTSVGDALLLGVGMIEQSDPAAIILISDGSSSRGVDPLQIAFIADQKEIPIHTIAIGTSQDVLLGYDVNGSEVYALYDIDVLQDIAAMSNGVFAQVDSTRQLDSLVEQLQSTLSSKQKTTIHAVTFDLNRYLIRIVLIVVFLYLLRQFTILSRIKSPNHK